jgi:hypothetical protein
LNAIRTSAAAKISRQCGLILPAPRVARMKNYQREGIQLTHPIWQALDWAKPKHLTVRNPHEDR